MVNELRLFKKKVTPDIASVRDNKNVDVPSGTFISVVFSTAPKAMLAALTINNKMIIDDNVPNTEREISVKIKKFPTKRPVKIGWTVYSNTSVKSVAIYLIQNNSVTKMGTKNNMKAGELWSPKRYILK
jgi:hypothetical protein